MLRTTGQALADGRHRTGSRSNPIGFLHYGSPSSARTSSSRNPLCRKRRRRARDRTRDTRRTPSRRTVFPDVGAPNTRSRFSGIARRQRDLAQRGMQSRLVDSHNRRVVISHDIAPTSALAFLSRPANARSPRLEIWRRSSAGREMATRGHGGVESRTNRRRWAFDRRLDEKP